MGRHSTTRPKPRRARDAVRRVWHLLPTEWRGRVWVWRQRWRAWRDHRHTPRGEWDAHLPKDPSMWADDWQWGSFTVAANLRTHRRRRGDLLPDHHDQEKR